MSDDKGKALAELADLRQKIDELDSQIVKLLNKRAEVVVEVGQAKRAHGAPSYAPGREHAVLERIAEFNKGPLPQKTLQAIYRELMSGSFTLEKPLRIGYLGPEGSFSQMAAQRKFGASVEYLPLADIQAIFDEVARKDCDLGLVPIENSVGGGVVDTLDAFIGAHVHICCEVILEVHHNLLANCGPDQITAIASKPEVFAQCRKWISTFGQVEQIPVASTSKAAEMAASQEGLAAIGSVLAADHYKLKIVFENIEDNPKNMTRFFVISTTPAKRTGKDKTSIVFSTAHRVGALVKVLNVFARHDISLSNIVTRPSMRENWEYFFFVDAEGHCEDPNFVEALSEARDYCGELHVLGSFPLETEPI